MDKKFCYIDVETTGTDEKKHGIHQISGEIVINGESKEAFDFKVRPFEGDEIEQQALDVSGVTKEQIMAYTPAKQIYKELKSILGKYVEKFERSDKYFFVAYNSPFDSKFLRAFFEKNGDEYYGSWFRFDICVLRVAIHRLLLKGIILDNYKLNTVAEHLEIAKKEDARWHDAEFDIFVTREIFKKVSA